MSAARRKGKWVGGMPVLGYDVAPQGGRLVVNRPEGEQVRHIFQLYRDSGSLDSVLQRLGQNGWTTKQWITKSGKLHGGRPFNKNRLMALLGNVIYIGQIRHQGELYPGEHEGILDRELWNEVNDRLCEATPRVRSAEDVKTVRPLAATPQAPTRIAARGTLPRIARLLALAIRLEALVREGAVRDYAELARLGHVTRARMTQVMSLLYLAPDIQESILFWEETSRMQPLVEANVRHIAQCIHWDEQRRLWRYLVRDKS
jgi:hypothetical protein